uniref:Agmatine deiminase n=1 Tax=Desulfacinum infernum TaxID=35837 RepID=A0A832A5V7_9BACT
MNGQRGLVRPFEAEAFMHRVAAIKLSHQVQSRLEKIKGDTVRHLRATGLFIGFVSLFFAAFPGISLGGSGTGEGFWRAAERSCHGDVHCMIQALEDAPDVPSFRGWIDSAELLAVLKKTNRFHRLGLTDAEGEQLLQAVFKKLHPVGKRTPRTSSPSADSLAHILQPPAFPYRAPAEFEPLRAVLFRWPSDWPEMQPAWARMIDVCAQAGVTAAVWVTAPFQQQGALAYLQEQGIGTDHIRWVVEPTSTVWIRDYGPQVIRALDSNQWGVVDFHYYDGRRQDDNTPLVVALGLGLPYVDRQRRAVVYTEGGNLNHDGLGCVVYSQRTYKRNPGVSPDEIDRRILSAFEAKKSLVPKDLSLDGTGHVDMFMKIVGPDTVLMGQYGPDQTDYAALEENAALFARETNGEGAPWRVVRLVQPDVSFTHFLVPVVRTYTNALMVNNHVIVPVYGIPEDEQALAVYREVLPGKTIVPLNAEEIIPSGGAWHCVTMEVAVPAGS